MNREEAAAAGAGAGAGTDVDAEGWDNFAVAQKGAVWMEGYVQGYQAVRRRLWRRVYLEPGPVSKSVSKTGSAGDMPPPV